LTGPALTSTPPDSCPWSVPGELVGPGVMANGNSWAPPVSCAAAAAAAGINSCQKCNSMKPLLVLLQKVRVQTANSD
jgi:hypothetical protein